MLVQKGTADIKSSTNTILKTLFHEKSSSVKRTFTSSCAIILKYASLAQAQKLIEDTTALHLGEKNAQVSGAVLLRAYFNNVAEVLSCYSVVVVPVTFVSRYVYGLV
jgi:proteasome component ECM29